MIGVTGWLAGWLATVKRTGEAGTDGSSLFVAASGILFCFLLPASENGRKLAVVSFISSVSKVVLSGWAR